MADHAGAGGFFWVKRPIIQSVNMAIKIYVEHPHPWQRIFPNKPFDDSIDSAPLFNIVEACGFVD
jgi:hypothetical protein